MHVVDLEKMKSEIKSVDLSKPMQVFSKKHPEIQSDSLNGLEQELRRFLEIRGTYTPKYGISGIMDEVFHSFILCTKEYTEFCDAAYGVYMHHSPAMEKNENDIPVMYIRFLIDYARHFKEIPPVQVWPLSTELFGDVSDRKISTAQCIAPCFW